MDKQVRPFGMRDKIGVLVDVETDVIDRKSVV